MKIVFQTYKGFLDTFVQEITALHDGPVAWARERDTTPVDFAGADVLVVWNGRLPWYRAAVAQAQALGIPVCYLEYGFFPDTLQMDGCGVNAAASIAALPAEWFAALPHDPAVWLTPFAQRGVEFTAGANALPGDVERLPARAVVVPLQLDGDTQLTDHSPWIRDMAHLLDAVCAATPEGMPVIVKEHPSAATREETALLHARYPRVTWCRYRSVAELLPAARVVVTVNSSVGLQALCRRVPVVACGAALWAKPAFCQSARNGAQLAAAIHGASAYEPDCQTLGSFLTYLRGRWGVPYHFPAMYARICAIAKGATPWMD